MTERESLCEFFRRAFRRRVRDMSRTAGRPLAWPSAVLLCVRHPNDHPALLAPFKGYPVASRSGVLGPVRDERCVDCGALMYVAAARVIS